MNEIEFPTDLIDYRERGAANADDASAIRARSTPPANEPDAGTSPGNRESRVDSATQERLRKIRAADREKVEALMKRDSSTNTATDEAVKPAAGAGKPLGSTGVQTENTIRPKPIFEKTGYDVPKSVSTLYVMHEGKFLDRKSETVHFEDKGRSLSTASEDRDVIAHMVEVAKAKNWGELQLKGTEEFRRQAWIATELAGVPTRGFKPKAQDRAALTAAREAMRIGAGKGAGERSNDADKARTNEMEPADAAAQKQPASPESTKTGTAGRESAAPEGGGRTPATQPSSATPATASPIQDTPTPAGVTAGVLVAHGPAPFNHDEKQNDSYYATVRTQEGERTVWGLDLERAIAASGVQTGQQIELEKGGSRSVTAQQRQFDKKGKELAPKTLTSRRNEWFVSSPDVPGLPTREQREALASARREADERRRIVEVRERFLKGEWKFSKEQQATLDAARERIKAQAAREVLRDEIKNLPEQQQETLMGEFESVVAAARAANRPLDVPMPQVSEATIEAVREQIERERAGQDRASEPREQTSDQPTHEVGHEAGHDSPTLELEP
ncbi:LPD7 domain-containing protein [Caballeronia sp. 15715]|uniref:LPD7 domain-containing protein n=1 Tax=Caballeronia sp. 15715 TaxID=3391030 RepID=UPI0039E32CE5